jgi:hypothetical protein
MYAYVEAYAGRMHQHHPGEALSYVCMHIYVYIYDAYVSVSTYTCHREMTSQESLPPA